MAKKQKYDLVIIGSGPGGYVAAVRAAQLGMKVACIDKNPRLGGVCLNVGCIPSKALLDSSEYYHLAKEQFAAHGIKTGKVTLDLAAMMARKEKVVQELTDNVRRLLEGHKIDIIHGTGKLAGPDRVEVENQSGAKKNGSILNLQANSIILATGSEPIPLPNVAFNGRHIVGSREALNFDSVPGHLGIVGGGLYRPGVGVGLAAVRGQGYHNRNASHGGHHPGWSDRTQTAAGAKTPGNFI